MDEERRTGMDEVNRILRHHGERLARVETVTARVDAVTDRIDTKLDSVIEKLAKTREQAAEKKKKIAILWAGSLSGIGVAGHAIVNLLGQLFNQKGH